MVGTITRETKSEGQRNAKKHSAHKNQKKIKKNRAKPQSRKLSHSRPL